MSYTFFIRVVIVCNIMPLCLACTTEITGPFALQQAIAYHDPSTEWATFSDTLYIEAERSNSGKRYTTVYLDIARDICFIKDSTDQSVTTYKQLGDSCEIIRDGIELNPPPINNDISPTCETFQRLKGHYTFLYGLPMVLTEGGVNIIDTIARKTFQGKDYAVIEARFADHTEEDVWFIYLDPRTYRMEVYQFFDTDANGQILPESGNYVVLDGEFFIGGMNIPQSRSWYTNASDAFLGTDILTGHFKTAL